MYEKKKHADYGLNTVNVKVCLHENQFVNTEWNLDHNPHGRGGSESGLESSLPRCKRIQSGSGSDQNPRVNLNGALDSPNMSLILTSAEAIMPGV